MVSCFFSIDPQRGQWIAIEPTAGGWGARADADGESALINLVNGSFRNISAEVYETKFPIRVEEFALRQDSGGPGKWRGGCGVIRRFKLLENCSGALWFDRSKTPAWGLAGGQAGAGPAIIITLPDGAREHLLKMRARELPAGTIVDTRTGGGGGYGKPDQRALEHVMRDVRRGLVSVEAAQSKYGVAMRDEFRLDQTDS